MGLLGLPASEGGRAHSSLDIKQGPFFFVVYSRNRGRGGQQAESSRYLRQKPLCHGRARQSILGIEGGRV